MATFAEYTRNKKKKEAQGLSFRDYTKLVLGDAYNEDLGPVRESVALSEIAPVKDEVEERKWFEKGAFSDGYQFGDIVKTIAGSAADLVEDAGAGIAGMGEKAVDALLFAAPYVAQGQYYQNGGGYSLQQQKQQEEIFAQSKKGNQELIQKDLYNEEEIAKKIISAPIKSATGLDVEEASVFGEKTDSLAQSGGQLLATAGLQAAGVPWFLTTGATSFGAEAENALNQGATMEEAGLSAAVSAGAEILTEKLFGGIKFGGKTADDFFIKPLTEKISSKALRVLANLGVDAAGEGFEEVVSSVISNLGTALYKEENIGEILGSEEALEEYLESFFGGAVLGGGSSAISAIKAGVKENKLTDNEKKVVDKETADRIAEQETDGKKLTENEKKSIKEQVRRDLEKGYISTDTIESVLGGKTYESYKTINEREKALKEEVASLQGDPRPSAQNRLSEASAELEQIEKGTEKSELKDRLSQEVQSLTSSDRLSESYKEKARRNQVFEADLSKYDSKMQDTVKRAVDSGILNNTNRTHDFVDLIAKLSAQKGVSFDFMNNESLKKSGFAIDRKVINGLVKGNDIIINIDSQKALNTVVGHEITHVLEGTELYMELQNVVKEYATAKGEYDSRYQAVAELYKDIDGADIDAELTADLVGDYLFTDSDFVSKLSTEKPNIFKRIYEEIKYLCKVATAGSKQARELEKVKRTFDKAYKESTNTKNDSKVQYNVSEDANLYQYVKDALSGKLPKKSFYKISNKISDRLASDIEKIVGFSVKDYGNEISPNHIKHINDRHGENGKSDHSMKDISDLARIGYVIENYDRVIKGDINREYRNKDGSYSQNIVLQKKIDDNYYYVVEAVPDANRKTLHVVSAYINKNDTFPAVGNADSPTPDVQNAPQSNASFYNNSIPQNSENTSVKNSVSKENQDIGPVGNYNVYGKDIRFEAPIKEVKAGTEVTEEAKPIEYELGTNDDVPVAEDVEFRELKESNIRKINKIKANIQGYAVARDISLKEFDDSIAKKQAEYESLKRKDTQKAATLLRQIESLKSKRGNTKAEFKRKIEGQQNAIDIIKSSELAYKRKRKTQQYRDLFKGLMGDTATWRDKRMGISYQVQTLRRNLRDTVRNADGSKDIARADAIYEEIQGKYNHNEALLNRETNQIKKPFKDMKITSAEDAYIQMLGEFKYNPDTTIKQDDIDNFLEKNKGKIDVKKVDKAIEDARQLYDSLLARVNKVLSEHGFKEIGYRQGYFPHMNEPKQGFLAKIMNWKTRDDSIPTDIAGLTEQFNPERSWQSFDKHRTTDVTDYSFTKGLDSYVQGALDWVYHIEDIQKRRAFENEIRYQHSSEGVKNEVEKIRNNPFLDADQAQEAIDKVYENARNPLNNFVTDLRNSTNNLAGKKSTADRSLEYSTNRLIYSTMTNISNRVNGNTVVGSISSALTNFIPITQSWGQVSPISSLRAMGETIRSTARDDGVIEKSDFLTNRLAQAEKLYQTTWDRIGDKASLLMESVDFFTSQTIWRSKYNENIRTMSEAEAIADADQFTENVMGGRSRGNMPTIFNSKNPITKVFTAFQLEVANQYGYMFKDMPQDIRREGMAKLVRGYATMFAGAYAYNILSSALTGRNAAFDPIRILQELLGDLKDEEEPIEVLGNLASNVVDELPYVGGLMGGGRIPISSAIPYDDPISMVTEGAKDIADGDWKNLLNELSNPLYYGLLPMGGGQIKKTVQGLSMFDDDLPIAGSYTVSGNLRFPVEDTLVNRIQAGLFGQYANENAREYFDRGETPLKEKQIQEFIDVDLPIKDYWEYREGLSGLKTLNEKGDYIGNLDIPISKKNILINNIADRKTPIDFTGFEKYPSFEEFDFAADNSEKYILSKAITDDVTKYKQYTSELNNIKSDKDVNGNSIAGSAKAKKLEYINNLDLDYGQKIILYRSLYDSKADKEAYNADIVEYLSNRTDITYEEMVTILETLDFKVYSDGTVEW